MNRNTIYQLFKIKRIANTQKNNPLENLKKKPFQFKLELILFSICFVIFLFAVLFKSTNTKIYKYFYVYLFDLNFGSFVWMMPFLMILPILSMLGKIFLKKTTISIFYKWLHLSFATYWKRLWIVIGLFCLSLIIFIYLGNKSENGQFIIFSHEQALKLFANGWYKSFVTLKHYQNHLGLIIDTLFNLLTLILGSHLLLLFVALLLYPLMAWAICKPLYDVWKQSKRISNYHEYLNYLQNNKAFYLSSGVLKLFDFYFYLEKELKESHTFPFKMSIIDSLLTYIKNTKQLEMLYEKFNKKETIKNSILADNSNIELLGLLDTDIIETKLKTGESANKQTKLSFGFGKIKNNLETKFNKKLIKDIQDKEKQGEDNDTEI
ncbi:hypothetical protein [Mycoplasmopsis glycophila]|uniref:Uncharacterized protein n=1 Tax=Mycoplasmopsis glycophila TaxID=171285 RepID=A0A449AUJ2_9BACT|nr:hypothetical protein [Mycoplasmopsis glycophila]VEU70177.1 Uncharacterised protein [Mycoplasmopsis glycophila]